MYDGVVVDANGRPIVVRWSRLVATDDRLRSRSVETEGHLLQFVAAEGRVLGVVMVPGLGFVAEDCRELEVVTESVVTAPSGAAPLGEDGPTGRKAELVEFLLRHGPMPRSQIMERSGIPEGTVSYCLNDKRFFELHVNGSWFVRG